VQDREPSYSEAELDAAVEALSDPERFREAETAVAAAAPKLQRILAQALESGGWFAESHEAELRRVLELADQDERENAVRTLLAEEARMGMMVGVAVGWALATELEATDRREA
jgi:hypothetical protein